LNALPKVVFSRTLRAVTWNNARLARREPATEIAAWKSQPGRELALFGSANLAAALLPLGLIDEVRVFVTPCLLGRGHPTFHELPAPIDLKLTSATTWRSGTVALVYQHV
jgi:dihydrofolate reductase